MPDHPIDTPPVQVKPKLPPEIAAAGIVTTPVRSCVYFLLDGDEVVYVGSSKTGTKRVGGHIGVIPFDAAVLLPTDEGQLEAVECEFIRALQPKYNTVHTSRQWLPSHGPKDCPLTRHSGGQWFKKYKRRAYYFGRDLTEAMTRFKAEWPKITGKVAPLFRHQSGQWAKKHKGRTYYFGSDLDVASERFKAEWPLIVAGQPRPLRSCG